MIAVLAMVSYSASAELAPQWTKGTVIANAGVGVSPFGGTISVDYVLVDEWWKGHFTVGGEAPNETNVAPDKVWTFDYPEGTEFLRGGFYNESIYRSAPSFDVNIDGITEI